jgi:Domain of unknown function (DUF4352)
MKEAPVRRLPALALILVPSPADAASSAATCVTFPETGKQVCDRFLQYWQANGGLAQQGLPLSDEFQEVSPVDGKTYTVQYFERAVFEKHPENAPPYDVLLSLLGREKYLAKYPGGLPTSGTPVAAGQTLTVPGLKAGVTFRMAVSDVQYKTELPSAYSTGGPQHPNGKYLCVLVTVTNLGQESSSLDWIGLNVRDGKGRSFDTAGYEPQAGAGKLFGRKTYAETIQPSFSLDLVLVFDVATDAENLVFVIDD